MPDLRKIGSREKTKKEQKAMSMLIFPCALIALDVGAAIVYLLNKDYKKAVYWLAAAVLNITVTF